MEKQQTVTIDGIEYFFEHSTSDGALTIQLTALSIYDGMDDIQKTYDLIEDTGC